EVNAVGDPAGLAGAFGGRGGGGGGGRGGAGGGQACDHPTTQWEQFCARPAEAAGGGRGAGGGGFGGLDSATAAAFAPGNAPAGGGRGGRGGGRGGRGGGRGQEAVGDLDPIQRIWSIIGMNPPNVGGRGGGVGGGFGGGGANLANTGDYLVSMTVNGQTYKQTFRVERVSGGSEAGGGVGEGGPAGPCGPDTPGGANR